MRQTIFSPCRLYRYTLWREWDMFNSTAAQFLCLNPSTADETQDDPTVRRCIDFAKRWGYGAFCMTNIFAWRDTDPEGMKREKYPIGGENDRWIMDVAAEAGIVVAGWGIHGAHMGRGEQVKEMFGKKRIPLYCLGVNEDKTPRHPLFLSKLLLPTIYK